MYFMKRKTDSSRRHGTCSKIHHSYQGRDGGEAGVIPEDG